jgi:hypothetical protein
MEINDKTFAIGDTVWVNVGRRERTSGKVVMVIPPEELGYHTEHYIIEFCSACDCYLEIREKSVTFATKKNTELLEIEQQFKELKKLFKDRPLDK